MSAADAVMLVWVAIMAADHWRTMRKLEQEARRPRDPSPSDRALKQLHRKLIESEQFVGRDDGISVTSQVTIPIDGECFIVSLKRGREKV